jgi:hypothetical protein
MDNDSYKARLLDGFEGSTIGEYDLPPFMQKKRKACNPLTMTFCFQKQPKIKEIEGYYKLKQLAIQLYDSGNEQHEGSLAQLYIQVLNCELTNDLTSEDWHMIGFQVYISYNIRIKTQELISELVGIYHSFSSYTSTTSIEKSLIK